MVPDIFSNVSDEAFHNALRPMAAAVNNLCCADWVALVGGWWWEKERRKMEYNQDHALGYIKGCRAMLDAFITAYHEGTLREAVGELERWNCETLNPWRNKVEDAGEGVRFSLADFPVPFRQPGAE
jgi:hypothetical protein